MVRVPYRDPVQGQNDVAEGRVHFYWSAYAIIQAQAQAGRIKVLAVTSSDPSPILPGIPTVTQQGYPELTLDGLIGLFGTRDMPLSLRETDCHRREGRRWPTAAVAQRLTATGQTVMPGSASEFAAAIEKQRASLGRVRQGARDLCSDDRVSTVACSILRARPGAWGLDALPLRNRIVAIRGSDRRPVWSRRGA